MELSIFDISNNESKQHTQTATSECDILVFNISDGGSDAVPDGFIDLDDYIDNFSENPDNRQAIADVRQELATDLCDNDISITSLRLQRGWSQRDLARMIGTQQPHICRIEAGTVDLQLSTIKKLAAVFDIPVGQLTEALAG